MTKGLKLRNNPNVELLAQRCKPPGSVAGYWVCSSPQLRMRFKSEVVINFENDYVDSEFREALKLLAQRIEIDVSIVIKQMQPPDRLRGLCSNCRWKQRQADQNKQS